MLSIYKSSFIDVKNGLTPEVKIMKKKLWFILPLLCLSISGCKDNGRTLSLEDEDEEEEEIPEFSEAIYGSEAHPLTVAQLITNIRNNTKQETGKFSYYAFTVAGYPNQTTPYSGGQLGRFFIGDSADGKGTGVKVLNALSTKLGNMGGGICLGDKIVLKGYTEYYNGENTFYPKGSINPDVLSITRGTSTFSFTNSNPERITVDTQFESSYQNMTQVTFNASTTASNYNVEVVANGQVIHPKEDTTEYTIMIQTSTVVTVSLVWTGDRHALPADTYTERLSDSNIGLPVGAGVVGGTTINYSLVADDPEHEVFYEQVSGEYTVGVYINSTASFHEIDFLKSGKIVYTAPRGKFTQVKIATYNKADPIAAYYGGQTRDSYKLSAVDQYPSQEPGYETKNCHLLTYDIPSDKQTNQFTVYATDSISIYYVEFTLVVA